MAEDNKMPGHRQSKHSHKPPLVKFEVEGLAPDDGLILRFGYDEPSDNCLYSFSHPTTPDGSETVRVSAYRAHACSSDEQPKRLVMAVRAPDSGTAMCMQRGDHACAAQVCSSPVLSGFHLLLTFTFAPCKQENKYPGNPS
jgi:hypothetical protein